MTIRGSCRGFTTIGFDFLGFTAVNPRAVRESGNVSLTVHEPVVDEFGTSAGLVTFEDVIETVFGFKIMLEKDKVADLRLHARNLWKARARKMGIQVDERQEEMGKEDIL